MLKPTWNFSCWLNQMLRSWSELWNLSWFISWIVITHTKLTLIIHAPSVDVASHWKSYSELLAHFQVTNHRRDSFSFPKVLGGLSSSREACSLTWRNILFDTIAERNLCRELTYCFHEEIFRIFLISVDCLVVSTSAPLVDWPVV